MPVRFLIADDVPAQQKLLANVVMMLGGESRLASNGREALRLAENETFDMVLMDLQMPELGGVAAANHLIESWKSLTFRPRIVAVTGDTGDECRALCRAVGMDGFIEKPFAVTTLRRALKQLIMQGHCWEDGPARRILNVARLEDAPSATGADFEMQALAARSTLQELIEKLDVLKPDECIARAESLGIFARRHGMLRLAPEMETFLKAARNDEAALFAGQLEEQKADFELTLTAIRAWRRHVPEPLRMSA